MRRMSLLSIVAALALTPLLGLAQAPEELEHDGTPAEYVIGVEDVLKVVTWG